MEPLDKKVWQNYYKLVKQPMWLSKVLEKLSPPSAKYRNENEFEADMRLIFSNCYYYNPIWSSVCKSARELETYFNELIDKPNIIPEPSSPSIEVMKEQKCFLNGDLYKDIVMDENYSQMCLGVLKQLQSHSLSAPFLQPVPQAVPLYHEVISYPMDLSTVEKKLRDNRNFFSFSFLFFLIFFLFFLFLFLFLFSNFSFSF